MEALYTAIVNEITAKVEQRILEHLQQLPSKNNRRMSATEAAEYIGVARKTLYTMCAEKQIAHIPVGARGSKRPALVFQQSTLDAWLKQQEMRSIMKEGVNDQQPFKYLSAAEQCTA
ncbi:helix-turn-helix domain-containing protein [Anaerospora hongkongensis]|uniref:helix-turn-helix domain-containing protein n=1 Tax=Anaerospora hongkongensis TaxID=244830 RepID=UPI0028A2C5FD|nr:helix-turn-helix domain-containing protein [Anaerospora hongkongensis]